MDVRCPVARRYAIHNPARPQECLGEFADSTKTTSKRRWTRRPAAATAWADIPARSAARCSSGSRSCSKNRRTSSRGSSRSNRARRWPKRSAKSGAPRPKRGSWPAKRAAPSGRRFRASGRASPATPSPNRSASSPPSVRGTFRSSRRCGRLRRRWRAATPSSSSRRR